MAELFNKDRRAITRHIQNIFKSEELDKNSVCSFFEHTASDNKVYKTQYYNLDMIISIGYRVNSKQGILFRKWATSVLKDYMLKGYAINEKRLDVLNKTIAIQSKMLAFTLGIEEKAANLLYFLIKIISLQMDVSVSVLLFSLNS